jgi:hypothetical protein
VIGATPRGLRRVRARRHRDLGAAGRLPVVRAAARAAAPAVLGGDRADYARALGRLGDPAQAAEVHRAAGLTDVHGGTLRQTIELQDAAGVLTWIAAENGHVRRLDATLDGAKSAAVIGELDRLLSDHRAPDGSLRLARTITLVTPVT